MERLLIVSGDGHASALPEVYREYYDPKYRYIADELIEENAVFTDALRAMFPMSPEDRETINEAGALDLAPLTSWDSSARLAQLDREGVTAEVLNTGTQFALAPGTTPLCRARSADERAAGARAHHRWMAEFTADSDGRLWGVLDPLSCLDLDATIAEMHWAKDHGFATVFAPGCVDDPAIPPLYDRSFDPFWATCVELGFPLTVHAGWGGKQGLFPKFLEAAAKRGADAMALMTGREEFGDLDPESAKAVRSVFMLDLGPRLVMWQLMLGGVFDRHPGLKVLLVEVRADWIPATVAYLDRRADRGDLGLTRRPSEYWSSNCAVVASSIHRAEVEMRHDIGVDRILFGTDFPHPEGTWPNTIDWLRFAFAGVPEDELRLMLGENALGLYGLDRDALTGVAARIGPSVADVLGDHSIDPLLVDHFDKRCGIRRAPEEVDLELLDEAVELQVAAAR